jgi:L-aminopeptidase/D-esterase-like protein
MNPLFLVTVQKTEETIMNAMNSAKDLTGMNGHEDKVIPHQELRKILADYNRLSEKHFFPKPKHP